MPVRKELFEVYFSTHAHTDVHSVCEANFVECDVIIRVVLVSDWAAESDFFCRARQHSCDTCGWNKFRHRQQFWILKKKRIYCISDIFLWSEWRTACKIKTKILLNYSSITKKHIGLQLYFITLNINQTFG